MGKQNPVFQLLHNRGNARERGIYSCCSANEYVIRAALRRAAAQNTVVLVEATANQVNQNGGYTGMTPADFKIFLERLAEEEGVPSQRILCGGDHLGPLIWQDLPEEQAMANAKELVRSYVLAGFSKIHIDTSMRVADDDQKSRLPDAVIARRSAELCKTAEEAFVEYQIVHPDAPTLVYVIGSEVPIPGGAQENEDHVIVTLPTDCEATLDTFRSTFTAQGLEDVWDRVVAMVVQPGVEFADESVVEYDRNMAQKLMECLHRHSGLVFEGHSTDYQTRERLREMVEDGVAILKVGPALTFKLREGLFALEDIERELSQLHNFNPSDFRNVLEQVMMNRNSYWVKYYHGTGERKRYAQAYSFSDRARYYLTDPQVEDAIHKLLGNLDKVGIPLALLSQYMPAQYARIRTGTLKCRAADLLIDHVGDCIDDYLYAVMCF